LNIHCILEIQFLLFESDSILQLLQFNRVGANTDKSPKIFFHRIHFSRRILTESQSTTDSSAYFSIESGRRITASLLSDTNRIDSKET
jgi:hypothetical protein